MATGNCCKDKCDASESTVGSWALTQSTTFSL